MCSVTSGCWPSCAGTARCGCSELARDLGVSELTIRRDITALAQRNLVTKVHGGATLPTPAGPASRPPAPRTTTFTIGMVVPSLDFYWPPVVTGARAAAAALGVTIQLRGSSYDPDEDRRQISRLVEAGQVQGLLLAPSLDGEGDATRMIDWIGSLPVPTVLVERAPSRWTATPRPIEWVRSDHAARPGDGRAPPARPRTPADRVVALRRQPDLGLPRARLAGRLRRPRARPTPWWSGSRSR